MVRVEELGAVASTAEQQGAPASRMRGHELRTRTRVSAQADKQDDNEEDLSLACSLGRRTLVKS